MGPTMMLELEREMWEGGTEGRVEGGKAGGTVWQRRAGRGKATLFLPLFQKQLKMLGQQLETAVRSFDLSESDAESYSQVNLAGTIRFEDLLSLILINPSPTTVNARQHSATFSHRTLRTSSHEKSQRREKIEF